jgi:hypothetical protein
VQYRASDTNARDNQIKPHFNIVNVGTTSIPLHELTIRYWYTSDGNRPEVYWCDYAVIGCSNVTGRFVKLSRPELGADSYLEIGFTASAGTLAGNGQTGEIQNRFNKDDYSNYDESDDYSFDPSRTSLSDWMRVTLYHNGGLLWGTDPSCANPGSGTICGADASVDSASGDVDQDVVTIDDAGRDAPPADNAAPDATIDANADRRDEDDSTVDSAAD